MSQLTAPTVIPSYSNYVLKKTEQAKPKFLTYATFYIVNNFSS